MPSPTSGCPILALLEAILISQASASSQPPPRAKPFIAAITGLEIFSNFLKTAEPCTPNSLPCCTFIVLICSMSAPATKALPSPVIIKTLICSSESICSKAQLSSLSSSLLREFIASGLFIFSTAMLSTLSIINILNSI